MKERTACDGGSQAASKELFTTAGEGAIVKYVLWPQAKRRYHSWASGQTTELERLWPSLPLPDSPPLRVEMQLYLETSVFIAASG